MSRWSSIVNVDNRANNFINWINCYYGYYTRFRFFVGKVIKSLEDRERRIDGWSASIAMGDEMERRMLISISFRPKDISGRTWTFSEMYYLYDLYLRELSSLIFSSCSFFNRTTYSLERLFSLQTFSLSSFFLRISKLVKHIDS